MFSAMCECQALHPDPEDDDSDNDFEGEEYDVEEAGEEKQETFQLNASKLSRKLSTVCTQQALCSDEFYIYNNGTIWICWT